MVAWRTEFEQMKTEEHLSKLKELGLDEEDLEEFKEIESGTKSLEDEIVGEGPQKASEPAPKIIFEGTI